ncbi:carbohydrate ABC transporter permease [Candidatus Halobonum tyrrellensis]|uniref:Sugar ABC transporter permease n=1 Tax=Candidatus Halobonum tyrrellensis G22 TaxID=1324957 RepID=V4HLB6_9EURY|nr:sugar ABC transporter permease [Candidatus Halobonum tyrrellensis]ESP88719.1 sugar ABC transporter permease [Candidatus Halobonum tyrrellensis G22]
MATESESSRSATRRYSPTYWVENMTDEQFAYFMLLPAFALVGAFALWPLWETFQMSLHADNLTGSGYVGEFVGIENYVAILTGEMTALLGAPFFDLDQPLQSALSVTLIYTAISVTLELIVGFGMALILDKEFYGRRWVRVAILVPWAVPIAIQGMIFYLIFLPSVGFGTQAMHAIGLFSDTPFINSADLLIMVIIADVWKTSAFIALIVLAGLQSIDRELYRVGRVAGASAWQRFRYITFPLVVPTLLVALLFRTIQSMRIFGIIRTIGGSGGCSTLPSLSCLVVTTFQGSGRYATAAALAFITAVVVAIVAGIYIVGFADVEGGAI